MRRAFTLIELLIVIAIIAILALIAIPNFLDAQIRSKVARAQTDMRTIAAALEAYIVDYGTYPNLYVNTFSRTEFTYAKQKRCAVALTTPVAYMNDFLYDIFALEGGRVGVGGSVKEDFLHKAIYEMGFTKPGIRVEAWPADPFTAPSTPGYQALGSPTMSQYLILSYGPNRVHDGTISVFGDEGRVDADSCYIYDPTNGTVSAGDIFRVQGTPKMVHRYTTGDNS